MEGKGLIKVKGSLSIYDVAKLRDEVITCLETRDEVVLDLSNVTDCDTAGIQLLCAATKTSGQEGQRILIEKASDSVVNALSDAGINSDDILGLLDSKISNPISKREV